ncbi:YqjD family protein [Rugamonas sp. CCM 8940]|uniref:DUF883 family protein n=1 Tax=Rugamonas sp. CCM 8940 TaxID=2765359 RepID=UPI0018F5A0CE|nr:DUF883 family protein [Rugamonas sp. CCM 8940]MBJ7314114.1 DUF883 family protein [Rugamonas sp. CCM 8940]
MDHIQQNGKAAGDDELARSQAANATARDKLMSDLQNVIHEAESWLDDSTDQLGAEAGKARRHFEDALLTAKSDLRRLEEGVLARGRQAARSTQVYVRDNPWKAVGLGAAVGVIAGMLIGRK